MPSILSSLAGSGSRSMSDSTLPPQQRELQQQQQQFIQMPGLVPSIPLSQLLPGFNDEMSSVHIAPLIAAAAPQSFMDVFMNPDPQGMFPQQKLQQPAQPFDVSLMPPHLVKQGKQPLVGSQAQQLLALQPQLLPQTQQAQPHMSRTSSQPASQAAAATKATNSSGESSREL